MAMLIVLLQIVLVIVSLLLVGVILLQRTKGAGAGVTFGGMGESLFGAEVGNVLTRATIILGSIFLVLTLALSVLISRNSTSSSGSIMENLPVAAPIAEQPPAPEATPAAAEAVPAGAADEVVPSESSASEEVVPAAAPAPAAPAAPAPAAAPAAPAPAK